MLGEAQMHRAELGRVGPDHRERAAMGAKTPLGRFAKTLAEVAAALREDADASGQQIDDLVTAVGWRDREP
jgi:hypothetical protein